MGAYLLLKVILSHSVRVRLRGTSDCRTGGLCEEQHVSGCTGVDNGFRFQKKTLFQKTDVFVRVCGFFYLTLANLKYCECELTVEHFLDPNIRVCRGSCSEDHVSSARYACQNSRTQKSHTDIEWKIIEYTLLQAFFFNSNRDSSVISHMMFQQRRGLTVLLPATPVGGPFLHHKPTASVIAGAFPFQLDLQWSSSCSSGQSAAQRGYVYGTNTRKMTAQQLKLFFFKKKKPGQT